MGLLYLLEKIRMPGLNELMLAITKLGEETALLVIALIAATLTGFSDIFQSRQISEVSYYMVYMLLLTILMKAFGAASLILEETLERIIAFCRANPN